MKTNLLSLCLGVAVALFAPALYAAEDEPAKGEPPVDLKLQPDELQLRPSFETCSYYFLPPAPQEKSYVVEFRRNGDSAWQRAFAPVTDKPVAIWKGSVFGLQEDSAYQLRVLAAGEKEIAHGEFHTWSSHPHIAKTIDLSQLPGANSGGLVIEDQGTPDGWIRYTAPAGWKLQGSVALDGARLAAITFRHARNVILEGVTIVGGPHYAIMVDESTDVRVLNCELTAWGRVGVQQFTNNGNRGKSLDSNGDLINLDGGVEINRSVNTVIERCYIHDPRGRSNSWMFSHPSGPTGIHVNYARGGTVVRWNDIIGSDEHRWNDVIETTSNSSVVGGFYRDADITGNFLTFGNDDGIELEGGGMNVRFYRNKIEGTTCGVSTGACILGPQYVIGNVLANLGDESGLSLMLFKNSHGVEQGGKRIFINNTLYSLDCAPYGNYGKPTPGAHIGYMRNNVIVANDTRIPAGESAKLDDFDHDFFWTNGSASATEHFVAAWRQNGQEVHGAATNPGLAAPYEGDFHLSPESSARHAATAVANICAAGDDAGAFFGGVDEIPARPLALHAAPRELDFATPARTEVTLSLPRSAAQPLHFEVRQNRVFNWFQVTPASGDLKPGDTLKLAVTVDPALLKGRARFKGAFIVRTPDGLSRPVTVYAKGEYSEDLRPAAAGQPVYLGAGTLASAATLQTTDDPGAAGGKYLLLDAAAKGPALQASFDAPKAGHYSLLARMAMGGARRNRREFDVAVDQTHGSAVADVTDDYQWNIADKRFRVVYLQSLGDLAAGPHTLELKETSGETRLNELIVTDHPEVYFVQYWQRDRTP